MNKNLHINKKKILVFNLFLLLCILVILLKTSFQDQIIPTTCFSVSSLDYEGYVNIYCKTNSSDIPVLKLYLNKDKGYFFLPSCTKFEDFSFQFNEDEYLITINNVQIHSQDSLTAFSLNEEYQMCITNPHSVSANSSNYTLTFMQSDNLPSIFINTESNSIDRLNLSKANSESGTFVCIMTDGSMDSHGFLSKISCHGNSSFDEANKKSYQITFYNATDILSMGSATKYILQANAFDPTYMRNKLVYDFCNEMGMPYTVDSEYVDLYFNGEYTGNYLLCEKVELGNNRIDISNGYLIEKVWHARVTDNEASFNVDKTEYFIVKEPTVVSQDEIDYLTSYMNMLENKISSCASYAQYEELSEYINIDSFIDMYLINAITNDIDSNIASTYYYKMSEESGGQLYAGPVWDYDKALGGDRRGRNIALSAYPSGYCEELFKIKYFKDAVIDKFNQTVYPLSTQYNSNFIIAADAYICNSRMMDSCRWENRTIENTGDDTYDEAVSELEDYMQSRLELVNDYLNHPEEYHDVVFINMNEEPLYRDSEYWISDGESIPDKILSAINERFHTSNISDENGNAYNNMPIHTDIILYCK